VGAAELAVCTEWGTQKVSTMQSRPGQVDILWDEWETSRLNEEVGI